MADLTGDDAATRALLQNSKTIAVVGASNKPDRDSHMVFKILQGAGYNVIPVNPAITEVAGVKAVPDLAAAREVVGTIDIVDVFRAADQVPGVVDDAIAVGAKSMWFQFGVVNPAANARAVEAGMDIVVDKCMKIELARLL